MRRQRGFAWILAGAIAVAGCSGTAGLPPDLETDSGGVETSGPEPREDVDPVPGDTGVIVDDTTPDAIVVDTTAADTSSEDTAAIDASTDSGADVASDTAAADAPVDSGTLSGSGGLGGVVCTPAKTRNTKQPYCLAKIGTLELKLFVPPSSKKPMSLAFFLHGDTANGYFEDWGYEALSAWAIKQNVLFAAVLAPNRCSWWRPKTTCGADRYDDGTNSREFAAAIEALAKGYDVYRTGVRYVGYSGGSTFLAGQFLPLFGDKYPGVVAANCGGVAPIWAFSWPLTTAGKASLDMVFTYGDRDFMYTDGYIPDSIAAYKKLGFPKVEDKQLAGYSHCDGKYDWDARTIALWSR